MEDQLKPSQFSDPAYSEENLSLSDKASVHTFSDCEEHSHQCNPPHYSVPDSVANFIGFSSRFDSSPAKPITQFPVPTPKLSRGKSEVIRSRAPSQAISEIDELFSAEQEAPLGISEDKEHLEYLRFLHDLEFLSLLSNHEYLHFLAQHNYLGQSEFLNYLEYLTGYFQKHNYIKFLKYPVCLDYAHLILKSEAFREKLKEQQFLNLVEFQGHCSAQDKYGAPQKVKRDTRNEIEEKIAQIEDELKKRENEQ